MVPRGETRSAIEEQSAYFALAAFGITWIVTGWQVGPSGTWSNDHDTVRLLSGSAVDVSGILSFALAGIFRLIPIGTEIARAGLASAFGAAWFAWFAYQLTRHTLMRDGIRTGYACWLAVGSSLLVTLGSTVQQVATVPNGSTAAAAISLACVWLLMRFGDRLSATEGAESGGEEQCQRLHQIGGLIALAWLESVTAGLLSTTNALLLWALWRKRFTRPAVLALLSGLLAVLFCLGLPWFLARRSLVAASIERSSIEGLLALRPFSGLAGRFSAWKADLTTVWCGIAVIGLVLLLLGTERRSGGWAVVSSVVATALLPTDVCSATCRDATASMVGLAALSTAAAKGVWEVVRWMSRRRPSAAALSATLSVLFLGVTVLARNEDPTLITDNYRSLGAEAWTDEALAVLPVHSMILARRQSIVDRLSAAQVSDGLRPDVLVVPLERATHRRIVTPLLAAEPALAAVLRDLAINGRPSENALSSLADSRPLFVEVDGNWDARLRDHLLALPFYHRVFSQTLGRSDRAPALQSGRSAVARILEATACNQAPNGACDNRALGDTLTRSALDLRLREQLTLLLSVGDRQGFDSLLSDYEKAFTDSVWSKQLRQRIGPSSHGSVDVFDLLVTGAGAAHSPTATKRYR
jgi:hypothetical protein